MRAAVMRDQKLVVDTLAEPEPARGEVLVKTLACGICGSDLHVLKHAAKFVEQSRDAGAPFVMDLSRDIVMGHEFCAELVDYGRETEHKLKRGSRVCSIPALLRGPRSTVGYSNEVPGGYGEYMVLAEPLLLPVPDDLSTEHAALTEPMAVGLHAVEKAQLDSGDVPLVIGCGPVGLAVIASLKWKGAAPIVAADFSPRRRELALALGADQVVDPGEQSPYQSWQELARLPEATEAAPSPFRFGPRLRPGVVFECVGVPGVIQEIVAGAPRWARIVVVGVCMEQDQILPLYAISKELNLQFVLGYSPEEFANTLRLIASGELAVEPLVTGKVGVEGVAGAFEALANPEAHAKILVEPWRS